MSHRIAEYVQFVTESLVENPDDVTVTEEWEDGELFVDVDVAVSDRGRVIGKQGRLIRSLRVVVRAAGGREGIDANVELVEDER